MTAEDRTRFEVLLESLQRDVKVIAEGYGALSERLDRVELRLDRLEDRFEQVEMHIAVLEAKVNILEARLDSLSVDTQFRLERIEAHLGLNGAPRPGKRRQRGSPRSP